MRPNRSRRRAASTHRRARARADEAAHRLARRVVESRETLGIEKKFEKLAPPYDERRGADD